MTANRLRVVFMGSPAFAVPSLRALAASHDVVLVVAQPDKPAGRGQQLQAPAVKSEALSLGLEVAQPARLRGDEGAAFIGRLQALDPDVLVVAAYGKILPPELLAVPRLGPWNVHASLLPRYRGAAPIQWAVINGDERTGVCIMRMEAGLDTGPVASRREVAIGDQDTAGELFVKLAEVGAALLLDTLPGIADGRVVPEPQDESRATLARLLTKEDGRLDFMQPARLVSARARGVDPWPGAFAMLAGEPLKLFRPRVVDGAAGAEPGTVLPPSASGLCVACGQGAVAFAEVQLPGRKRLPAAAVLAGRAIPPGTRLG